MENPGILPAIDKSLTVSSKRLILNISLYKCNLFSVSIFSLLLLLQVCQRSCAASMLSIPDAANSNPTVLIVSAFLLILNNYRIIKFPSARLASSGHIRNMEISKCVFQFPDRRYDISFHNLHMISIIQQPDLRMADAFVSVPPSPCCGTANYPL